MEAEFESSDVFHDAWKLKARDVIARAEFRRQKMVKRLKEEEERIEDGEDQTRKKLKASREHHKKWEETREDRSALTLVASERCLGWVKSLLGAWCVAWEILV